MTMQDFAFDPPEGLRNATEYPDPDTEAQLRGQVQDPADQLRDYINGTLKPSIEGKDDVKISFTTEPASKTLGLTDRYKWIQANHATVAINFTVPPSSSVAWEVGDWIIIDQIGAAQAAVVAGSGVTFKPSTKLKVNGQDTQMVLTYKGSDVWSVSGSTKA